MIKLCTVCNIISLFMAYVPERKKCSVSSFELPQYWQVGLHLRNLHINVHLSYLHVLILCAKIFSIHILKTFPIINLRKKSVFYRGGVFFLVKNDVNENIFFLSSIFIARLSRVLKLVEICCINILEQTMIGL